MKNMTVTQIKEHAKLKGIAIPSATTKKADMITHIQEEEKKSKTGPSKKGEY